MIIIFEMLKRIGAETSIFGKVLDNEHGNLEDVEVVSRSFAFNSNVQAHDLARRSDESKRTGRRVAKLLVGLVAF